MTVKNLFHKYGEAREYRVAERLLSGKTASFDDLRLAAGKDGKLSKNSLSMVIGMIEDQCGYVVKKKDFDIGTVYRYVEDAEYDPKRALTNPNGKRFQTSDMVRLWRGKIISSGAPRRF